MLHKDYQINKVGHSTSTAMSWLSEVLRSQRSSATLANVVQEQSQISKHKDITYIQRFSDFSGKI